MNCIVIENDRLQHNIDLIKNKVKDIKDDLGNPLKIIAVLKGNAYGMGMELFAKKLIENGIDFFAVTEVAEAIELRKKGFNNEILILNSTAIKEEVEEIVKNNLIASVDSEITVNLLNDIAKLNNKVVQCHLKIDTGFGRFGFLISDDIGEKISNIFKDKSNVQIMGTYSHFQESYAKESKKTKEQFRLFMDVVAEIQKKGLKTGMLHICNSSAFFKYPEMYLNAVRIGSAFSGRLQIQEKTGLKRVGYLESEICEIRELPKGYKIGYSGTCKLKRNTKVGIVEAGYAEGIGLIGPKDSVRFIDKLRMIKNSVLSIFKNGIKYVEIKGEKYPILGRIGMKNFMIDITDQEFEIGEKVKIDITLILSNSSLKRVLK